MEKNELIKLIKNYIPKYEEEVQYKNKILEFIEENEVIFGKKNSGGHITGSAWIINKDFSKALLVQHKKLDRWLQAGGHSEEGEDIKATALREAQEETGLRGLELCSDGIFDLDIHLIPKNGKDEEHIHYDLRFAYYADEMETLVISSESKNLRWFLLAEIEKTPNIGSIKRMVSKSSLL